VGLSARAVRGANREVGEIDNGVSILVLACDVTKNRCSRIWRSCRHHDLQDHAL